MSRLPSNPPNNLEDALRQVAQLLDGLSFGSVEITVHHGRIVQIERHEKFRLDRSASSTRATPAKQPSEHDRISGVPHPTQRFEPS